VPLVKARHFEMTLAIKEIKASDHHPLLIARCSPLRQGLL
jgi:hypothetical protein